MAQIDPHSSGHSLDNDQKQGSHIRFILLRSSDDFLRIKDFCKSITSVDNILRTLLVLVYQMKKKYNERSLQISRRLFDEYLKKNVVENRS